MAPDALTPRQREVYVRVVRGESDRKIAVGLGLSVWGVREHMRQIVSRIGGRGSARSTILHYHAARK